MEKSVSFTTSELCQLYSALEARLDFYKECYLSDSHFRECYPCTYDAYLALKSAFKKVDSAYYC